MKKCVKCNNDKELKDYPATTRAKQIYYNKMCKTCTATHNSSRRKLEAAKRADERELNLPINPYFLKRGKID